MTRTLWNTLIYQNFYMDHSLQTTDLSFTSPRQCDAKDSVSTFVFISIQKYIDENPRRSAFKIQNVLCEQAFNCFAWVTSFFLGKHREEERTPFLTYGKHKWMPDRKTLLRKWTRLVSTSILLHEFYFYFQIGCFIVCNPTLPQAMDTTSHTSSTFLFFTIAGSNLELKFPYRRHRPHALCRMMHDSLSLNPSPRRTRGPTICLSCSQVLPPQTIFIQTRSFVFFSQQFFYLQFYWKYDWPLHFSDKLDLIPSKYRTRRIPVASSISVSLPLTGLLRYL